MLREADVDVLVGTTYNNVRYLSDFQAFGQRFLPTTQVYAIVRSDQLDQATVIAPLADADMYAQFPAPAARILFYGSFYVEEGQEFPDALTLEYASLRGGGGELYLCQRARSVVH